MVQMNLHRSATRRWRSRATPIRSGCCATASRSTRSTTKTASSRRFSAASARRPRTFVEFGVETGVECNTVKLLIEGWRGLWIEANAQACKAIASNFAPFLKDRRLTLQQSLVTAENINAPHRKGGLKGEIDLLSIDIDFNDYWVWKAIEAVSPRVVVIEYNAGLRPPLSLTVPYQPNRAGDGTNFFGASLEALVRLGRSKGYRVVGCNISGSNAFFVREDLCADHFIEPATAEEHYEPPRHFFSLLLAGPQAPRPGPYVAV